MSLFTTYPASPLQLDNSGNLLVNVAQGTISASSAAAAHSSAQSFSDGTTNALQADLTGALKVNVVAGSGSGLSVTDEAAFTAGTSQFAPDGGVYNDSIAALTSGQTGADRSTPNRAKHVNLRNNAGTEIGTLANAVRVDPVGTTTQPVSAASLPLPSGAATSAKQPALGTAGSASADVLTVQGIASMTAFKVDGSGVTQPVSGTVTANAGTGTMTVAGNLTYNNAAPGANNLGVLPTIANAAAQTWTEGDQVLDSCDLKGNLRTKQAGSGFTAGQVSITTTATLIAAANNSRMRLLVTNLGTTTLYIGGSGVTSTTGHVLQGIAGYPMALRTTAAVYGITASGSQSISYLEETA